MNTQRDIEVTFTQCKQVATMYDLRDTIEALRNQPIWITHDLGIADIQAIQQGGCASGAYMPAVTYWQAAQIMETYGDDVLQYIDDTLGELPTVPNGISWSELAVFYLSCAVELWAGQFDLSGIDCA